MDTYAEFTDELSGDGMIIIDGRDIAIIPYSLTLAPRAGSLVGEVPSSDPSRFCGR